jgi:hypothetical protein
VATFLFYLHIAAAFSIGVDAYRRGRSFIAWTLLTMVVSVLVTWPLLYILPRRTQIAQTSLALATHAERDPSWVDLRSASKPPTNNKSFYVGVTVWVVFLIVGIGIILK